MIKRSGGDAVFVKVDVSQSDQIQQMIKTAINTYGRIDILYNNASIQGPIALVADIPEEEWFKTLDTNVNSVFRCSKYTIPYYDKSGWWSNHQHVIDDGPGRESHHCAVRSFESGYYFPHSIYGC